MKQEQKTTKAKTHKNTNHKCMKIYLNVYLIEYKTIKYPETSRMYRAM